jgi:DnaJ-class molecular chaperone
MTYIQSIRRALTSVVNAVGCGTCGGQGKVGGSANRTCPACGGTGKSALESRRG